MIAFLTADGNLPFAVALLVMLVIAVLEGVTTILGAGLSSLLESVLPDFDLSVDTPDMDGDGGALSRLLGWLRVGEVPVLVLLVLFLTGFGLIGLGVQSFAESLVGNLLPWPLAVAPAFALSLPVVRTLGGALNRVMPKDETDAVSSKSLVGRTAVITLGTARKGHPAEARTRDAYGTTHYVMVEPLRGEEALIAGTEVLLVEQAGAGFHVIKAEHPALID